MGPSIRCSRFGRRTARNGRRLAGPFRNPSLYQSTQIWVILGRRPLGADEEELGQIPGHRPPGAEEDLGQIQGHRQPVIPLL